MALARHRRDRGLVDDTLVVYMTDNGWDAAAGLASKRAKRTPYELGIRTPILVRLQASRPQRPQGEPREPGRAAAKPRETAADRGQKRSVTKNRNPNPSGPLSGDSAQ